jgi:predicted transcriptional regulator
MLQPHELIAAKLLPTIRARLAQVLLQDYGMKQVQVAKQLGITQAAVSHYNTRSRAADDEILELFPEIDDFVAKVASRIEDGLSQTEQIALINLMCDGLSQTQRFCEYHKRIAHLDPECNVCFVEAPVKP